MVCQTSAVYTQEFEIMGELIVCVLYMLYLTSNFILRITLVVPKTRWMEMRILISLFFFFSSKMRALRIKG